MSAYPADVAAEWVREMAGSQQRRFGVQLLGWRLRALSPVPGSHRKYSINVWPSSQLHMKRGKQALNSASG